MKKKPSLSELLGTVPVRVGDWNDFLNLFKTKEDAEQAGEGKEPGTCIVEPRDTEYGHTPTDVNALYNLTKNRDTSKDIIEEGKE